MTLKTPTGPIGALLESLVAPSLPFRAPLGLEIWAPGRALGGPIRALGSPVRVLGPLGNDKRLHINHFLHMYVYLTSVDKTIFCVKSGGAHTIFFPGAHSGCLRPCMPDTMKSLTLLRTACRTPRRHWLYRAPQSSRFDMRKMRHHRPLLRPM